MSVSHHVNTTMSQQCHGDASESSQKPLQNTHSNIFFLHEIAGSGHWPVVFTVTAQDNAATFRVHRTSMLKRHDTPHAFTHPGRNGIQHISQLLPYWVSVQWGGVRQLGLAFTPNKAKASKSKFSSSETGMVLICSQHIVLYQVAKNASKNATPAT